jgi:uncharacterized protein
MNVAFPFRFDARGRTETADDHAHIEDMIELVLFTAPGERVNRPDFGSGLMQLVFAPNSDVLAATTQYTAQAALQQWLGHLIEIDAVEVSVEQAELHVEVRYAVRHGGEMRVSSFVRTP